MQRNYHLRNYAVPPRPQSGNLTLTLFKDHPKGADLSPGL